MAEDQGSHSGVSSITHHHRRAAVAPSIRPSWGFLVSEFSESQEMSPPAPQYLSGKLGRYTYFPDCALESNQVEWALFARVEQIFTEYLLCAEHHLPGLPLCLHRGVEESNELLLIDVSSVRDILVQWEVSGQPSLSSCKLRKALRSGKVLPSLCQELCEDEIRCVHTCVLAHRKDCTPSGATDWHAMGASIFLTIRNEDVWLAELSKVRKWSRDCWKWAGN